WPGNVRELRNAIERAILLCDGALIAREHLPAAIGRPEAARAGLHGVDVADGPIAAAGLDLEGMERSFIERAMRDSRGNKAKAARRLGLTRAQLYTRIEKYGLDSQLGRPGPEAYPEDPASTSTRKTPSRTVPTPRQ